MRSIAAVAVALGLFATARAQQATPTPSVLITDANVFDGQNETLANGMSVLIEGNKITRIAKSIPPPPGATVINANGRVLTPGLIDAHWHTYYVFWPISDVMNADFGTLTLAAAQAHKATAVHTEDPEKFVAAQAASVKIGGSMFTTFGITRLDPVSMKTEIVMPSGLYGAFGAATNAIEVGDRLWLGSCKSDRVAIFDLNP